MADSATTFKDPQLTDRTPQPKGVLQKNLKTMLYMGAVGLLILATFISSRKKTPTAAETAKNNPPQPYVQDNTANNVDALQRQLATDKLKKQQDGQLAAATGTGAQQTVAAAYGPDGRPINATGTDAVSGQPSSTQANGQPQLTPVQQAGQQLAASERVRADTARFASNIAYVRPADQPMQQQSAQPSTAAQSPYAALLQTGQPSGVIAPRAASEQRRRAPAAACGRQAEEAAGWTTRRRHRHRGAAGRRSDLRSRWSANQCGGHRCSAKWRAGQYAGQCQWATSTHTRAASRTATRSE